MSTLARTYLFVPGNRPERFGKAMDSGADAVIMDLEDAVADDAKPAAREAIAAWLSEHAQPKVPVLVRINDAATPWFKDDITWLEKIGRAHV